MSPSANKWFISLNQKINSQIRLFCFHHSGYGASVFREWAKDVPDFVELIAIQLPGRKNRILDPLIDNIPELIAQLFSSFKGYSNKPFILFGHSVGALIAFELAKELEKQNIYLQHLIVSGLNAPHTLEQRNIHKLPDSDFLNKLKIYNGIPKTIVEDEQLITHFLPILRSDFKLFETYQYSNGPLLLCPITAFGGLNDHSFNYKNLIRWKEQTEGTFTSYLFKGDHFFIKVLYNEIIEVINRILNNSLAS